MVHKDWLKENLSGTFKKYFPRTINHLRGSQVPCNESLAASPFVATFGAVWRARGGGQKLVYQTVQDPLPPPFQGVPSLRMFGNFSGEPGIKY